MEVKNDIVKVFVNKYQVKHVSVPHQDKDGKPIKIVIKNDEPYYIADIPENKDLMKKFIKHPFLGLTKDMHAVEVLTYMLNPKNFPSVYRMIHPNSDSANIHKYVPDNEEVIIANLRKHGWNVMRLDEYNSLVMDVETAKKVLKANGYEFHRPKELGPNKVETEHGESVLADNVSNRMTGKSAVVEHSFTMSKLKKYKAEELQTLTRAELNNIAKENDIRSFGKKSEEIIKELSVIMAKEDIKKGNDNANKIPDTAT